jgi:pterin-4a-carbinolamine dehydratase
VGPPCWQSASATISSGQVWDKVTIEPTTHDEANKAKDLDIRPATAINDTGDQ